MKTKRARRFVIGYRNTRNTIVWGRRFHLPRSDPKYRIEDYCERMTIVEARKALPPYEPGAVIYELVPVEN